MASSNAGPRRVTTFNSKGAAGRHWRKTEQTPSRDGAPRQNRALERWTVEEVARSSVGARLAERLPDGPWLRKQFEGLQLLFMVPLNLLLGFVPLGIYSGKFGWGPLPTFVFNFLSIVPLASLLGDVSEVLAGHTGQMLGGLLRATFGNAVEMFLTVNGVRAGLLDVVQQSLIGSILSNLLLITGISFGASGLVVKESQFDAARAGTSVSCLVLSSLALVLPTVYSHIPNTTVEDSVWLSRIVALVMALVYLCFLIFELRSSAELDGSEGQEEEDEDPPIDASTACGLLWFTTCCIAYCSEFLVASIEGVSADFGVPFSFIGLILLPITGNAATQFMAVSVAYKGQMDLSLAVAVGSSTQIALLVIPFSVIAGWFYNVPMTLDFEAFDAIVYLLSVFIASGILSDGNSNWFEGLMLCCSYAIVAICSWFLPQASLPVRSLSDAALAGAGGSMGFYI